MTVAAKESSVSSDWERLSNASFEIGGEDQLADLRAKYPSEPVEDEKQKKFQRDWQEFLAKIRIQTGTLLKTDTVSFLLGAGASKECGGVLIGKVPLEVERTLLEKGVSGSTRPRIHGWLLCFYLAIARARGDMTDIPVDRQGILDRHRAVLSGEPVKELPVNYERLLSLLYQWRSVLPDKGGRIRLDGEPAINLPTEHIEMCLWQATRVLADRCVLSGKAHESNGFRAYRSLLRKVLTRPLNLKRVNFFTLNYDTLVEQAADAEGIVLIDGFVGTIRRVFRPEVYDNDLYFPAETTEGRVHRHDRVIHLYKLHGSVTWRRETLDFLDNPYGVVASAKGSADEQQVIIYPTPAKVGETLGMPYAELFRRFAATIVRPQSTLFVLGYGFGDVHVNAIIQQALTVPSFKLVIGDPYPTSPFIKQLKSQQDRRVWIMSGKTFGTFSGFVEHVLPDLTDEEVRRMVIATQRALGLDIIDSIDGGAGDGK